ncbi:MAG: hypothetical protein FWG49_03460 [Leptospirales bacterium]|nr:hypothetical protein [Leptospirales bacterium]
MKRIILYSILISLSFNPYIYSQIKEPDPPYTPAIEGNIDKNNFIVVKARVTLQGRDEPLNASIALSADALTAGESRIKISDLSKINILMWKRRTRKINGNIHSYIFYPDRYELFFRNSKRQIIDGNIESLNKIRVVDKKNFYIYLYYIDYFQNEKWINRGSADFNIAFTTPIEGCVTSIELIE